MRQAFVPDVGRIEYREVERPRADRGQVVMRVGRIGICGSDVHVFKGEHPIVRPPLVQGHEVSGTVVELGEEVSALSIGDVVCIEPAIGCGECHACGLGLMAQCERLDFIGGDLPGPASELFAVSATQVVGMRPTTSLDDAAMVEPLACAVHAVRRAGGIAEHDVLVTGGGPIGALVAQVARLQGARQVIVSDPAPGRRRVLEACGTATIDPVGAWPVELAERFGGRAVRVALECSGAERGLDACLRTVSRGGTVVVVAVYPAPPCTDMVLVQDHELDVRGSLMYTWDDFREAARLVDEGLVCLAPLQTHHVPIDRWIDGYGLIDDPAAAAMKVLVDVT